MKWWAELKYLIRRLNRRNAERELEQEIRAHLELEAQEKIEKGLASEEAGFAARRAFGARLMTSLLYGAQALDPLVFAGVPLLLALVAFLACFFPARKATKVDPISVLRAE